MKSSSGTTGRRSQRSLIDHEHMSLSLRINFTSAKIAIRQFECQLGFLIPYFISLIIPINYDWISRISEQLVRQLQSRKV